MKIADFGDDHCAHPVADAGKCIDTVLSSLTDNPGFAAGIAIPVILLNYYSVTLAEYVSSTATGSAAALIVAAVILGFVIRYLTGNDKTAFGI